MSAPTGWYTMVLRSPTKPAVAGCAGCAGCSTYADRAGCVAFLPGSVSPSGRAVASVASDAPEETGWFSGAVDCCTGAALQDAERGFVLAALPRPLKTPVVLAAWPLGAGAGSTTR